MLTSRPPQLGVGCIYALFLWAAPDARKFPKVTKEDIINMIPVAFWCVCVFVHASAFSLADSSLGVYTHLHACKTLLIV